MTTKIKNKINIFLLIIISIILFNSCFKEPNYLDVPSLIFKKLNLDNNNYTIAPTTSNPYGNVEFEFTDGDADLGLIQTTDTTTLEGKLIYTIPKYELIDTFPDTLSLPEITERNGVFPKTGTILVKLKSIFDESARFYGPFSGKNIDTLTLKFWLIDRAGNISNTVTTPEFIVNIR
jgi:hypothetical protein